MDFYSIFNKAAELITTIFQLILLVFYFPVILLSNDFEKVKKVNDNGRVYPISKYFSFRIMIEYALWNHRKPNYEISYDFGKNVARNMLSPVPGYRDSYLCVNDISLAKEIMSSSIWLNRVSSSHYIHAGNWLKPLGLVFGCDEHWTQPRKIALKLLHQLDFFRTSKLEAQILFEIQELKSELLHKIENSPTGQLVFSPRQMFEFGTMNIVCQVLIGRRFEKNDPMVTEMMHKVNETNRQFAIGFGPLEIFRWLKYLPVFSFLGPYRKTSGFIFKFFKEIIQQRKESGKFKEEQRDFVDGFLAEIEKHKGTNPYLTVPEETLLVVLRDLILGGMDTTASALEHALLHVALQPKIQQKVQAEIDEFIGNRAPAYDDRFRMIYTQAVILEILRISSAVPVTSRSPVQDTKVEGYDIAKGSTCGISIYGIHRDEQIWENPEEFKPERFLNSEGAIVNADKIMPFGFGKRNCVGETLARCTLFIFFVVMMQNFDLEISKDHPAPSMENVVGLSRCPKPFFIVMSPRTCGSN